MFFSPHINAPRPEVAAFLDDAHEHPDDDTPRLILADWLDDNGDDIDRDRAEFIRVQCRLARPGPAPRGLAARQWELEQDHADDWLGPLVGLVDHWRFDRGLVGLGVQGFQCYSPQLHDLVRTETWAWVEGLTLLQLTPGAVQHLVRQPVLNRIRSLSFEESRLGDSGLALLAGTRPLPGLRDLRLAMCSIGRSVNGLAALADSAHLPDLERLDLTRNHVTLPGLSRLVQSAHLPRLRHLALGYNDLPEESADELAGSPLLAQLESLDLRGNWAIGGAGLEALTAAPTAARLRRLNLAQTRLGIDTLRALTQSEHLAGLTHLYLGQTNLPNEGLKLLALSPHLTRLCCLSLCRNNLTDEGVVALTLAPPRPLRWLELGRNHVGREGATALAGWPGLAEVEELGLEGNRIGDAGALALARSPFLSKLRLLDVGNNGLSAAGKAAVLRRFGRHIVLV
jgi:uncharacterized protein (TIGR02996 family)